MTQFLLSRNSQVSGGNRQVSRFKVLTVYIVIPINGVGGRLGALRNPDGREILCGRSGQASRRR